MQRRLEDPPCVGRLTPFELPAAARGGAQRVDRAACSWPRTHANGHWRSRCGGQRQVQDQGQARRRDDVPPLVQQDGPSQGRLLEVAGGTDGEGEEQQAATSESWILSVEVAVIDEAWATHKEDWVMVDSGAGVSVCPVDYAQESEVKPGSVKSPLVGAGGDRVEHIGQETVGNATREGANVGIAFDAAKVRRPLLSVDSLEEKGQVAVFTDSAEPRDLQRYLLPEHLRRYSFLPQRP